ncbi:hypothetical protein AB0A69_10270 [Streptomyces sp. NPDC045431]
MLRHKVRRWIAESVRYLWRRSDYSAAQVRGWVRLDADIEPPAT